MTDQNIDKQDYNTEIPVAVDSDGDIIEFCYKHPNTETMLHCYECNQPICLKCAQRTPVGYICPDCKNGRKRRFNKSKPRDMVIAGVAAMILGAIASVVPLVGSWWFIMILSPLAGLLIADIVWRLVGRRWGPNLWWITVLGIVVGTLPVLVISGLGMLFLLGSDGGMNWWTIQNTVLALIHAVVASGAAVGRLKLT